MSIHIHTHINNEFKYDKGAAFVRLSMFIVYCSTQGTVQTLGIREIPHI